MPWQPGQSGNPSGRPKSNPYAELMLEEYAREAVAVIVAELRSEDAKQRLAAAKDVLDRRYGRASQSIELGNKDGQPFAITRIEEVIVDPADRSPAGI